MSVRRGRRGDQAEGRDQRRPVARREQPAQQRAASAGSRSGPAQAEPAGGAWDRAAAPRPAEAAAAAAFGRQSLGVAASRLIRSRPILPRRQVSRDSALSPARSALGGCPILPAWCSAFERR